MPRAQRFDSLIQFRLPELFLAGHPAVRFPSSMPRYMAAKSSAPTQSVRQCLHKHCWLTLHQQISAEDTIAIPPAIVGSDYHVPANAGSTDPESAVTSFLFRVDQQSCQCAFQPTGNAIHSIISRQINLQWGYGYCATTNSIKICSRTGILFRTSRANPKHRPATWIKLSYHGFRSMAVSKPRRFKSGNLFNRQIRNIHIENGIRRQGD